MAFVTKYKLKRVLGNIEGDLLNDPIKIYISGKYYYLSDRETQQLTIYFRFLESPEKFIEEDHFKWVDTKRNAVEVKPAYHSNENCQALNHRFDNVQLPEKIQSDDVLLEEAREIAKRIGLYNFGEKSEDELRRFAVVCLEEMNFKHYHLNLKFDDFKIIHNRNNSGSMEYSNLTLQQIKEELEKLVKKSNDYFGFNEKRQLVLPNDFFKNPNLYPEKLTKHNRLQVLERYRNYLGLIAGKEKVRNNNTDFCSEKEVVEIAKEIRDKFSVPTVSAIETEIMKKAENREFGKTVLEVLGFRPCNGCNRNQSLTTDELKYIEKYKIK